MFIESNSSSLNTHQHKLGQSCANSWHKIDGHAKNQLVKPARLTRSSICSIPLAKKSLVKFIYIDTLDVGEEMEDGDLKALFFAADKYDVQK